MIRRLDTVDFEVIYRVINDAAQVYKGVIPADLWKDPYMSREELQREISEEVQFWGYEERGDVAGVMGIQNVKDVTLIRHAYVCSIYRKQGIGSKLLSFLRGQTTRPVLIGTWADAVWAIRFYERHGFQLVAQEAKDRLLRKYWSISDRQIEASVVLADPQWFGS